MRKSMRWMVVSLVLLLCLFVMPVLANAASSITLPEGLLTIEEEAFMGAASLERVSVPEGTTSIGARAFANSSLQYIELPASVESIADDAFEGCDELEVYAPEGSYAAEWWESMEKPAPASDFEYSILNGECTITKYVGSAAEVMIPSKIEQCPVTEIGACAFMECYSPTNIIIPEGVTSIGDRAFYACGRLSSMVIPEGVTSIGDRAFAGCVSLSSMVIPGSVETIQDEAFYNCSNLSNIVISEGVINIGSWAFYECSSLSSIVIPDSVISIGKAAFYSCSSLSSIVISDGVENIEDSTFYNCYSLTSIIIPDSVTSIGRWAFEECSSLSSIVIPDSVTSVGEGAFEECSSLNSIVIPDSVESIEDSTFYNCYSLTNIIIPDSVTSIGSWAFYKCSSLTNISIPDSVASIGNYAFYCSSLSSIVIPDNVESIEPYTFYNCYSLTNIIIPNSVTSIGSWAFHKCSSLISISIPEGVTSIGNDAFSECSSLISISIPEGVTSIGNDAFSECSSLISISIPNSVTAIGDYAFAYCSSLTSIFIPDGVVSIRDYTFALCSSLTRIYIPDSVTNIADSAFLSCYRRKIYCEPGSYAQAYAEEKNIPFSTDPFPKVDLHVVTTGDETGDWLTVTVEPTSALESYTYQYLLYQDGVLVQQTDYIRDDEMAFQIGEAGGYRVAVNAKVSSGRVITAHSKTLYFSQATHDRISGRVLNEAGSGLGGVSVCLSNADTDEIIDWAVTNASGLWSVRLPSNADSLIVSFDAEGYTFSPDRIEMSADTGSQVEDAVASIAAEEGETVSFTVNTPSIVVGTEAHFTVFTSDYECVRLIVDGVAYEKYPVFNGSCEVYRIFTKAGDRSVQFQGCTNDVWYTISEAQTLEVTSYGTLATPAFSIPGKHTLGTDLQIEWTAVENAEEYTVYLHHNGNSRVIDTVKADAELGCKIDSICFPEAGQYSVEVIATGYGYSQKSCSAPFEVIAPSMTLVIETPLPSSETVRYVVGDTFYLKVQNPNQRPVQIRITTPKGEPWYYPQAGTVSDAIIQTQYVCEETGQYVIEAFGYAGTAMTLPENSIATDRVNITVQPSEITDVRVGNGYGNQLIFDTSYIHAKTNNAVEFVKVYEGSTLLTTLTYEENCTEVNYVRTFAGSIPKATEGKHTIRFEAYDGEGNVAKRSFVYYAVTDAALSVPQYPVQSGLSMLKYPDLTDEVTTLYLSDALTVLGTYGDDLYYVELDECSGYVPKAAVFPYSPEDRAAIDPEITVAQKEYVGKEENGVTNHAVKVQWTLASLPEGAYMMAGLVKTGSEEQEELKRVETAGELSGNLLYYEADFEEVNCLYNAVVAVYTQDHKLLTRCFDSVYVYESYEQYKIYHDPDKIDLAFRSSAKEFSKTLLEESAFLAHDAYVEGYCSTDLSRDLGFNDVKTYNYSKNYTDGFEAGHSVAFSLGWKDVLDENAEVVRLYAVVLRGTQELNEWLSNFNIKEGTYPYGFNTAASDVYKELIDYMVEYGKEGKSLRECKIWLTGHSRGAAVANLLSVVYLRSTLGISPDNIYTYCFATPNCVKESASHVKTYVRNYVLGGDIIPYVPMQGAGWQYRRFGETEIIENGSYGLNSPYSAEYFSESLRFYVPTPHKFMDVVYPAIAKILPAYLKEDGPDWPKLWWHVFNELSDSELTIIVGAGMLDLLFGDFDAALIDPTHDMETYLNYIIDR